MPLQLKKIGVLSDFKLGSGTIWDATDAQYQKISGVAPLTIDNIETGPIKSLIQYGKCSQASTPSVQSPVNIYCNNGKLIIVDDELPSEYKRVQGFTLNNNSYWQITNFKLRGSDTVRLSVLVTGACNIFGSYTSNSATNNFSLYTQNTGGDYLRYGSNKYNSYLTQNIKYDLVITPTGTHGFPNDSTWEEVSFETSTDMYIGITSLTATSSKFKGNLYGNFVVDGRFKGIPCERLSDNVLGYYDTYSQTFYEPASGSTPVSLGYDDSHYIIDVDGTDEVLTVIRSDTTTQTASVVNLFGVDDYKDEQDLISGKVIRRCSAIYYDGTQEIGDIFLSTTGDKTIGAIIVYPLEVVQSQSVMAQSLSFIDGTNTIAVSAEVSDIELSLSCSSSFFITTQPVDYVGEFGTTGYFFVDVNKSDVTYKWQYWTGTQWDNSTSIGTNTNKLRPSCGDINGSSKFRCKITDNNSGTIIYSNEVKIIVIYPHSPQIVITEQPVDYIGAVGTNAIFSVVAEGDGLTYEWQYRKPTGLAWNISSTTTSSLSIAITAARNGQAYRCVITDAYGNKNYSNVAKIIVN